MKKARNGFIKNLRYLCLVGVIALGLMTIVGSNGGGSDTTTTPTTTTTTTTLPGDGGGFFSAESYPWTDLFDESPNRIIPIDYDSDNDLDVVITPLNPNTIPQTFAKLNALRNDGQANFTDSSLEVFQNAMWGNDNDYAVADFNGDGLMDLFIPESGPDIPPFPGGQSKIFIQTRDGELVDETTERLPIRNAFTHYCAIGDIDNDNDIDIFMNHIGSAQPELYVNDGNGYFSVNTSRLPNDITALSSVFLDIDKDGDSDLFVGSPGIDPDYDAILLNDGNGYFKPAPESALPPRHGGSEWITIEAKSADFNGDDWPDLILNTVADDYDSQYIQFLINNRDGTFNDVSSLIPDNSGHSFHKLADFNNDGWMDLLTNRRNDGLNLYFNMGEGGFVNRGSLLPSICKFSWGTSNIGDFDNDGDIDIFLVTDDGKYHVIKNLRPFDVGTTPLDAPAPPTLVSPVNEGTVSKSPTLSWNENGPTTSNHLQVATDADFSNILVNKSAITSNHYTVDLNDIQTYYWRVRGTNTGGTGQWSEAWSFTTENYAPTSIELSSNTILENSPVGTPVGIFTTTDPDGSDTHTYSFDRGDGTNDADNESFMIDGDILKTNVELDYATKSSYNIYVQTDDGFGGTFAQAFVIAVMPFSLMAHYPFNGNANDESGNGNHGTVHGAALTTDRFDSENSAYSFDGTDDNIDLGTGLGLVNNADNLTLAAWIYPYEVSHSGTGRQYTIVGERLGGNNYQFAVMDDALYFSFWSDGNELSFGGREGQIRIDEWHFVAVTYDGTTVKLYINEELDFTYPASGDIDGHHSTLLVGSWSGTNGMFNGKIDDIVIFNRALPEEEIISLFEGGAQFQ